MDYFTMLKKQPADKIALITQERVYTYGTLISEAYKIRAAIHGGEKHAHFIYEERIDSQLIKFIAYSGTFFIPVIATQASKNRSFNEGVIPDNACMGVMTSGSTGKSKLLWRSYRSWADFFTEQNRVFGIDSNTVIFCQGSLAFTGNLNIYMGVLSAGGTIVAADKFRPKSWLEMMARHNVNTIYLIPSKLLLLPKTIATANDKIRRIVSGSQSMGRAEAEKLHSIFPNADLILYYGASELNYISYIKGKEMTDDKTLIGKPFCGVKIEIRNEEIFVDTPYGVENIKMPFSLKDKGYLDDDGNLHFLGRTDDIYNINGMKISALKVENALQKAVDARAAAVIALHINDADVLTACLIGVNKLSKQEIIKALKPFLADYEIPKHFVYLNALPENESGKPDKLKLAQILRDV